jgi:cytochrome c oxidase subunit IV
MMPKPPRSLVWSWIGLVLLLALTLGMAFVPLGRANIAVALAVAAAKAIIVLLVFMELTRGHSLKLIFAGAGLFWLIIMFGLSFTDYTTRAGFPPAH